MKKMKRILCMLLALVMVCGMVPVMQVSANDVEEDEMVEFLQNEEIVPEEEVPMAPETQEDAEAEVPAEVLDTMSQMDAQTPELAAAATSGTWGDNLKWSVSNGTLSITGSGEMLKKWSVKDYPWYEHRTTVTKIVIGDYVTTVAQYAFQGFTRVTTVVIGNRVTEIGNYAFAECSNLATLTLGTKLQVIGDSAFSKCARLTSLDIPESVNTIKGNAFYQCTNLRTLTLQEGLLTIEYNAFYGCKLLDGILEIPSTLTEMGSSAFRECTNLDEVIFDGGCAIPDYAFYGCTSLAAVTIGNAVTDIGRYAFYDCVSLKKVAIPGSVSEICYAAFENCKNLAEVTIASGVTAIGGSAFDECTSLKSIKVPNTVTIVDGFAFNGCTGLTSATLGTGVTEIGNAAFQNCSNLATVTMGDNVVTIDDYAFNKCGNLSSINLSANLNTVGYAAFQDCNSLVTVIMPDYVSTIGSYAFYTCDNLTTVYLMSNVAEIGSVAFGYCPKLTTFKNYGTTTVYNTSYYGQSFYNTKNVTLYGYSGSTTEEFATLMGYPFVAITSLDTPAKPYKIQNVVSGVHVYWNTVPGAVKYNLFRSETGKDGSYKFIAGPTVAHFTDTKVETGKTYYYKVQAANGNLTSSYSEPIGLTYVGTPDISKRTNTAAGIKLDWEKMAGATGYAIYRKSYSGTDAWVRIGTIEGNSTFTWTDTSVKNNNGEAYKYTIRALAGADMKTLSGCRNAGRTMVRLSSQVLKSAAKASSTSVKCEWTTSSRVTGYEVRFMIGDEVYKTFTVGNYKTGVKTFTGLKSGATYTIQVRTYKKVDGVGSFYSDWSTAKTVTISAPVSSPAPSTPTPQPAPSKPGTAK